MSGKNRKNKMLFASLARIFKKEIIHMLRNPAVFMIAFVFPFFEFLLLGFILDLNAKQISTVVYDLNHTQESRMLLDQFTNTNTFHIISHVYSDQELYKLIVSGKAKIGIKI